MLIVKVKGVETREAAAALTGSSSSPAGTSCRRRAKTNIYYADLVGLEAVTRAGERLGPRRARQQLRRGRHSRDRAGGRRRTLLLPFTRAIAPAIDFEAGGS